MSNIIKYQASQMLKMSKLFEECGSEILSEELITNAENLLKNKNIKTASINSNFSKNAAQEYEKIRKDALSEISRYTNDLANDYIIVEKNKSKTILSNQTGNKIAYNTSLLKMAGLLDSLGSLLSGATKAEGGDWITGLLGGFSAEGGGIFGKLGKGWALTQFSEFIDNFAQEVQVTSVGDALASAKNFIQKNWSKLLSILAGVALYTWTTQKQNEQTEKQIDELETRREEEQKLPEAAAKSRRIVKTAAKQNVKNMCEMANYLDEIGDYRNAALLDSTARTIMKYVD